MKNPSGRIAAGLAALALAAGLAACGGDDDGAGDGNDVENAPVMTNEFGVETFEPGDDPFNMPETVEPD